MKESFKQELKELNELAKEDKTTSGLWSQDLSPEIKELLRFTVSMPAVSAKTQEGIYRLQFQKQKIFQRLKDGLKKLDDPEYVPKKLENQREVIMEDGTLYVFDKSGEKSEISVGEIMTDDIWGGFDYYLDPKTISRQLRKRYLVEKYKNYVLELLETQIAKSVRVPGGGSRKFITRGLKEGRKKFSEHRYGTIAEMEIENFFKKLVYDKKLDIEIFAADAEQETKKIDFIIRYRQQNRGVKTEIGDDYQKIGIQLTISARAHGKLGEILRVKEAGVLEEEGLTDIVLVKIPKDMIVESFNKWTKAGKKSGGPDKFLSDEDKKTIFAGILQGIFTPEEIEERWAKMVRREE